MLKKIFGNFTCCGSHEDLEDDNKTNLKREDDTSEILIKNNLSYCEYEKIKSEDEKIQRVSVSKNPHKKNNNKNNKLDSNNSNLNLEIESDTNISDNLDISIIPNLADDEVILVPDDRFILNEEKECPQLKFTKRGIINFFNQMDKIETFETFHDKNNTKLQYDKKGSFLNKNFYLGKSEYKMSKERFMSQGENNFSYIKIKHILNLIYEPEWRLKWDSASVKSLNMYTEQIDDFKIGSGMRLAKVHFYSPIFFISERDSLEKRIQFFHEGVSYNYSSAVQEEV